MSDFHCEVVRVEKVQKHPNADTLSIADANGQPVIFRTATLAWNLTLAALLGAAAGQATAEAETCLYCGGFAPTMLCKDCR